MGLAETRYLGIFKAFIDRAPIHWSAVSHAETPFSRIFKAAIDRAPFHWSTVSHAKTTILRLLEASIRFASSSWSHLFVNKKIRKCGYVLERPVNQP
jgi:hypothetical protein